MSKTNLQIQETKFLINGKYTYSGETNNTKCHGLLMNARFIQGIFDTQDQQATFARFGWKQWDPERNTNELIKALPQWKAAGLLAITVGIQGGGPCFSFANNFGAFTNNPYDREGNLDPSYLKRLMRLIDAADKIGMIVIVSLFYQAQIHRMDETVVYRSLIKICRALKESGYKNIILEVANEHDVGDFEKFPLISKPGTMAMLLDIAKKESDLLVACSGGGGVLFKEVADASDVILIHGNGLSRENYYRFVTQAVRDYPDKPIVCNEDSPCFSRIDIALETGTSWGYYNNWTKQEPPVDWGIKKGDDEFFSVRMANALGINSKIPSELFYFEGFEEGLIADGKRYIKVSALYPESINYVIFYCNGEKVHIAYEEPFFFHSVTSWLQEGIPADGSNWECHIFTHAGEVIKKNAIA